MKNLNPSFWLDFILVSKHIIVLLGSFYQIFLTTFMKQWPKACISANTDI